MDLYLLKLEEHAEIRKNNIKNKTGIRVSRKRDVRSGRVNILIAGKHTVGKRPRYTFFAVAWTGNVASLALQKRKFLFRRFPPFD